MVVMSGPAMTRIFNCSMLWLLTIHVNPPPFLTDFTLPRLIAKTNLYFNMLFNCIIKSFNCLSERKNDATESVLSLDTLFMSRHLLIKSNNLNERQVHWNWQAKGSFLPNYNDVNNNGNIRED